MAFFDKLVLFLRLPVFAQDTLAGKVGYWAEFIFLVIIVLFIVDILIKIYRGDPFFTSFTTTLSSISWFNSLCVAW